MSSKLWVLPVIVAAAALISGSGDRPRFHGVHEGSEAGSKLPYELMYSGAAPLSESEAGRALLEGCLAAYGGRDHLTALESFRFVHERKSDVYANGPVRRVTDTGRRYRVDGSGGEVRTLAGNQAWLQRGEKVEELPEGGYRGLLFSYLTMRLPGSLESERFDEPRYARRAQDPLGYLFFDKADTLMLVVGIDPETHLIHSSEGVVRHGDRHTVYINRFSDHQEFDGYIFPRHLELISLGMEVGQSELVSVEINTEVEDREFDLGHGARLREGR
jgi:hypothetical protein